MFKACGFAQVGEKNNVNKAMMILMCVRCRQSVTIGGCGMLLVQ